MMPTAVQSKSPGNTTKTQLHECPITYESFKYPYLLLEDGFTYERAAIQQWLKLHPNRSPMIGDIPSTTLLPNCALNQAFPTCLLTRERYTEPYFCIEDCQTYEREAIIAWAKSKVEQKKDDFLMRIYSPSNGVEIRQLTLVPNKVLWTGKMPKAQEKIIISLDCLTTATREPKCILDSKIRALLLEYLKEEDNDKLEKLRTEFEKRRMELGLTSRKLDNHPWRILDLSHLDLSKMFLTKLFNKGGHLIDTNLSGSVLKNCDLSRCRFENCNMQETQFFDCCFQGEETSFLGSDMTNAIINDNCILEKGTTWHRITDWDTFLAELTARGAHGVDTITLRRTPEIV